MRLWGYILGPDVTLAMARAARDDARRLLASGVDRGVQRYLGLVGYKSGHGIDPRGETQPKCGQGDCSERQHP